MIKVGDTVKIRTDLKETTAYDDVYFVSEMNQYKGKLAKVTEEDEDVMGVFKLDIDDEHWYWSKEMLEPVQVSEHESEHDSEHDSEHESDEPPFKVGDLIKIKMDIKEGQRGQVYISKTMEEYRGKVAQIVNITYSDIQKTERYSINIDKGIWAWSSDMFERAYPKDLLKTGAIVKLRNLNEYVIYNDELVNNEGAYCHIDEYDKDLKEDFLKDETQDIIEIYFDGQVRWTCDENEEEIYTYFMIDLIKRVEDLNEDELDYHVIKDLYDFIGNFLKRVNKDE